MMRIWEIENNTSEWEIHRESGRGGLCTRARKRKREMSTTAAVDDLSFFRRTNGWVRARTTLSSTGLMSARFCSRGVFLLYLLTYFFHLCFLNPQMWLTLVSNYLPVAVGVICLRARFVRLFLLSIYKYSDRWMLMIVERVQRSFIIVVLGCYMQQ